jgi:hypothetical protein
MNEIYAINYSQSIISLIISEAKIKFPKIKKANYPKIKIFAPFFIDANYLNKKRFNFI